jgi:hypothetical protein
MILENEMLFHACFCLTTSSHKTILIIIILIQNDNKPQATRWTIKKKSLLQQKKIQNVNLTFNMTVVILMACGLWDGGKRCL